VLKIYGQTRSRTFRVMWLCKESNIPFEQIPISLRPPGVTCKEEWYIKINPNARVPTIDDDGFVMWESAAINVYLAKKYKSPLWPDTLQGEGNMLQWAFYVANDVEPPLSTVFENRFLFPPEDRDASLAEQADKMLRPKLKVLNDHLAAHSYFGGNRWDMADFMVASVMPFMIRSMKYDLSAFTKLESWLATSLARPVAQEMLKLLVR
jgi:glutathione S-transferase